MNNTSHRRMAIPCVGIACLLTSLLCQPCAGQSPDNPTPAVAAPTNADPNSEKFGTAPEDYSHQFLRQESVLLKPGQWQLDVGMNYTLDDHPLTTLAIPGGNPIAIDTLQQRRLLMMPLQFRFGVADRFQVFADMPVGWTNTQLSYNGYDTYYNSGGLGDTTVGCSYLLHKSCGVSCDPDIVATFGLTTPTSNSDILSTIFWTPETMLGQGVWAGSWNVMFIHTCDPVIVFYGFGSRHALAKETDGFSIRPGDQYLYRGGIGFAVNERITLSSTLYGYYINRAELDGQQIEGTSQEPVYLRFAATMVQKCGRICEPFAEIGMTEAAANTRFGLTWTF